MKCIITTVGTSLFTNFNFVSASIEIRYEAIKKERHQEWDHRYESIQSIRNNSELSRWICRNHKDSCAEMASLVSILETEVDDIEVQLLATDTVLSRLAAEMIKMQTIKHPVHGKTVSINFEPDQDVIIGLLVDDAEKFETDGLQYFVKRFVEIKEQYSALILNITGGYKGLIPYLTIIGQINQVPVKYKFEESDALITIPQLPINFDWELAVEYGLQISGDLKNLEEEERRNLMKNNILDNDGKLTSLGRIFKAYAVQKSVMPQLRGYCAEFRWFEYYVSQYPNKTVRRSVGNGQKIGGKKIKKEADIVLEGDGGIIIAESKSRRYIYSFLQNPDTQIENLLQEMMNNGLAIAEYHLCVYSTGKENISDFSKNPAIESIRAMVHKYYPQCIFILLLMNSVRELQGFMHKSFPRIKDHIQKKTINLN